MIFRTTLKSPTITSKDIAIKQIQPYKEDTKITNKNLEKPFKQIEENLKEINKR
jgi:hypothetical protein